MDIGLLVIRLVVGLTIAAHGAQKLFGAFDGHGLAGTGAWLESLGFRPGRRHAEAAGGAELAGGLLLALGWFTPLAAAAVIAVMIVAAVVVHRDNGFFVTNGGWEYTLVLAAAAAAVAFTGPGLVSVDRLLGIEARGVIAGLVATTIGAGAAAVQLLNRSPRPPASVDLRAEEVGAQTRAATVEEARRLRR